MALWVILADMELRQTPAGPDCNEALRKTVGLSYPEMIELAQKADLRRRRNARRERSQDVTAG